MSESLTIDSGKCEMRTTAVPRSVAQACARLGADLRFVEVDLVFRRQFGDGGAGRGVAGVVHPGFAEPLLTRLAELVSGDAHRLTCSTVMLGRECVPMIVEVTAVAVGGDPASIVLAVRPGWGERPFESPAQPVRLSELSARVLELVAVGMSSAQLAKMLFLSKQGVEYHVATLVRKLGAANRTGMVSMAYAAGVLLARQWPPKVNPFLIV